MSGFLPPRASELLQLSLLLVVSYCLAAAYGDAPAPPPVHPPCNPFTAGGFPGPYPGPYPGPRGAEGPRGPHPFPNSPGHPPLPPHPRCIPGCIGDFPPPRGQPGAGPPYPARPFPFDAPAGAPRPWIPKCSALPPCVFSPHPSRPLSPDGSPAYPHHPLGCPPGFLPAFPHPGSGGPNPPPLPAPKTAVAVRGVVYCKPCNSVRSLSGASQLAGAVVKVTCDNAEHRFVREATTDENGKFYIGAPKTFSSAEAHRCSVSLVSSPSGSKCGVPTDLNGGLRGARLMSLSSSLEESKEGETPLALFSVGPFAFEPEVDAGECPTP